MDYEIMEYITLISSALSGVVSVGIIIRILITVFNNLDDENAVVDGSISKKVKRLLKALIFMLCITGISAYLYNKYFS